MKVITDGYNDTDGVDDKEEEIDEDMKQAYAVGVTEDGSYRMVWHKKFADDDGFKRDPGGDNTCVRWSAVMTVQSEVQVGLWPRVLTSRSTVWCLLAVMSESAREGTDTTSHVRSLLRDCRGTSRNNSRHASPHLPSSNRTAPRKEVH